MPLGNIPWTNRLGISNSRAPNASEFANMVLRLPTDILIYQQQLVHSQTWAQGPTIAAAEWCGAMDAEINQTTTLREISTHDSVFARRNLTQAKPQEPGVVPAQRTYQWHRGAYTNHLYFALNEPEIVSRLRNQPQSDCNFCWDPRDYTVDPYLASILASLYWDTSPTSSASFCNPLSSSTDHRRIKPDTLAFLYLKLWHENQTIARGHIILPPSAADTRLGINNSYWLTFYNTVHGTEIAIPPYPDEDGITPGEMQALHIHHYTANPQSFVPTTPPLQAVANDASIIREAADWYRDTYYLPFNLPPADQNLPMDIVLSEFGLDWHGEDDLGKRFVGWFDNMRDGLSWWNSCLCWIIRIAPVECFLVDPLNASTPNTHALYAAIHNPTKPPYTKQWPTYHPNIPRNQVYYDANSQSQQVQYQCLNINTMLPSVPAATGTYESSFSSFPLITWRPLPFDPISKQWYVTPFGVCYAVWAQVGADKWNQPLGLREGWLSSSSVGGSGYNGIPLSADVTLPLDWSTIYFPVIKTFGIIKAEGVQFNICTTVGTPPNTTDLLLGKMCMVDFEDTADFTVNVEYPYPTNPPTLETRNQRVYSAMIFPVVCYSPQFARTITIKLERVDSVNGDNETEIILGRPIVLPNACSWFVNQ